MGEPAGDTPLRDRVRLSQVLLGVGAVLVVTGAAAIASSYGGAAARVPLVFLAVPAAAFSHHAALRGLRSTEETLAACATGLCLVAAGGASGPVGGVVLALTAVTGACLVLHVLTPATAAWPLGAWAGCQLAALRSLGALPPPLRPGLLLGVALVGLGIQVGARRLIARVALITTAPWWVAGVLAATGAAWTADGVQRQLVAILLVAAAAGLLPPRLRADLDPLLGPPLLVPVVSGAVAGVGVAGSLAALGTAGTTAAGYLGVLVATTLPELLTGGSRLFRPVALAAGGTMALIALVRLSAGGHWAALSLLLLLTAVPTALVAWRRPGERPATVPTAVGCLTGAALLAVPAGILGPDATSGLHTVVYAAALVTAGRLAPRARRPTVVAAGVAAGAAIGLLVLSRDLTALAVVLAALGALTVGWGWRTALPAPGAAPSAAWRIGAAELAVAAEIAAYDGGIRVLEAYTFPVAAALLLGAGPRLVRGPSWPAWGPGLLVAAVPSAVLAVLETGSTRPVAVLTLSAVAMVVAGALGVRAPLVMGAGTAIGVSLGLAVGALLWPLAGVLAVGAALLVVGARREEFPLAWFGARLADLR